MVSAEALREKHPNRDGWRINPALPKRSCNPKGFVDTLFRKQTGEVQTALPPRLRHRPTKRTIHLRPPCLKGALQQHHYSQARPFPSRALTSLRTKVLGRFKCHSFPTPFPLLLFRSANDSAT